MTDSPYSHSLASFMRRRSDRRRLLRRSLALGAGLPALLAAGRPAAAAAADPEPPVARVEPTVSDRGGVTRVDPYAWLEDSTDPEVIAYLDAENAYREAVLAPTTGLQESLYQEMLGRLQQDDQTVPVPIADWFYYTRTAEGQDYEILARKRGSLDAPEEVILDLNALLDGDYIRLDYWAPSPDHRLLAFQLNTTGGDEGDLQIKDLQTGELLPDRFFPVYTFAWANDSRTLFYLMQDDVLRSPDLYRHLLGDDPAADLLLYHEADETFDLWLSKSKDGAYIFVNAFGPDTSDVHTIPADRPTTDPVRFAPRRPGIQYFLEHHGDDFLVLTDDDAPNFKLMAAPVAAPDPANWRELVPHRPNAYLDVAYWEDFAGHDVFAGHVALFGREDGLSQLWILDLATGEIAHVPFEEAVYEVWGAENREFATTKLRFTYSSFVTPISTYELDLATGERTLLKQDVVLGDYDPASYVSERLVATAPDGAQVPISLVRRRDVPPGPQPLLLFGYGAYGYNWGTYFDPNRLSLLDRGVAYAHAHVRGGAELGRHWYDDGKLLNKWNTFTDFIACADHLVAEGRTSPDRLVANGLSAGGLLMGVIANERPDLFRAIVAEVPWVDVMRDMLDTSLPLVTIEFGEWGDPSEPLYHDYMLSYSPYDNVSAQPYPHLLITGGLEDDRVMFWNQAKWTAKLRAHTTAANPILLRMDMGTGHFGASGRYDALGEVAQNTAFILLVLGLAGVEAAVGVVPVAATTKPPPTGSRYLAARRPIAPTALLAPSDRRLGRATPLATVGGSVPPRRGGHRRDRA